MWLLVSLRETSELPLFVFVGIINDLLCVITSTSPLTSGRQSSIAITPYGYVILNCALAFSNSFPPTDGNEESEKDELDKSRGPSLLCEVLGARTR